MNNFNYIAILSILFFVSVLHARSDLKEIKQDYYKINKVEDGLYFMYFDSTSTKRHITKGTIVEFQDFIVLLEASISDHKTSKDSLIDHTAEGEKILLSLQKYFPGKPLKYVISSHWHPHSIGSVLPFISKGITLVTTKSNFERLSDFTDSGDYSQYYKNIKFVDADSLIIEDESNSITAYKISKDSYPSLPVNDFLFFHLPRYNYMHCSCMYQRFPTYLVDGREFDSPRVADVNKFLAAKHISPASLISIYQLWDSENGLIPGDTLKAVMQHGIAPKEIEDYLLNNISDDSGIKQDKFIKEIMARRIPKYMINRLIYKLLMQKELEKALALAKVQTMLTPSDPNVWDTLGETYYFLGEYDLAKKYGGMCLIINKEFTVGGEPAWKKDFEEFSKGWKK